MSRRYLLLLVAFISANLFGQDKEPDSTGSKWNFSAWAEMFILPDEGDFFNPTFYARGKTLHFEGRYNYEDRNTVSLWAGRRFKFGKKVQFVLVPMAGVVFGNTDGIAPGFEAEITYKKFDFYVEAEYVFDFESSDGNFFYEYTELAIRPIRPVRTGLMTQKTKVYQLEREFQRGIFAEYYFGAFRAGVFYFSPFSSDQFWIASVSVDF